MRIILLNMVYIVFFVSMIQGFIAIDTVHPRLLKQKKKQFCYISFIKTHGKRFLVKQKRNSGSLLAVVHDALAAHIAQDLAIAHKVIIIPAFKKFPGKIYDDWPATIHTIASGATIKEKRSPYRKMNIKQASQGFRREMIYWMAKHVQLVKILALDTFLCNHDRHRGNLFYDAQTKMFCAIDMDCLFEYNLPLFAYQNLNRMVEYDLFPLTTQELLALIKYRETLEFLINKYSSEDMVSLFDYFLDESGLLKSPSLCTKKIKTEIDLSRRMIVQSYKDTKILINVLGNLIKKGITLRPVLRNLKIIEDFEKEFASEM